MANNLKFWREFGGFSQRKLGEKVGLAQCSIHLQEQRVSLDPRYLNTFSTALVVSTEQLTLPLAMVLGDYLCDFHALFFVRIFRGFTQKHVADACRVSQTYYSRIEHREFSHDDLQKTIDAGRGDLRLQTYEKFLGVICAVLDLAYPTMLDQAVRFLTPAEYAAYLDEQERLNPTYATASD